MTPTQAKTRSRWQTLLEGWDSFWFTPADPATLGMIRIFVGLLLFYTHLVWTIDLEGFLGAQGRIPVEFVQLYHGSPFAWSYLSWISSPLILLLVHLGALSVFVMLILGIASRVVSVLAFLITVAYAHRVPGTLFGLDQVNSFLAMYLMIGPCGAFLSVDRWWAKRRLGAVSTQPLIKANIAIRLIQIHMCIVYLFSGLGKLLGDTWWNGTAIWGALANYEYQTLEMTWLAGWPLVINLLTQFTLAWEITYPALVWPRISRPVVIFFAIPVHLGIAVCLGMITFGLAMLIGNFAFVPPESIRQCFRGVQKKAGQGGKHFSK